MGGNDVMDLTIAMTRVAVCRWDWPWYFHWLGCDHVHRIYTPTRSCTYFSFLLECTLASYFSQHINPYCVAARTGYTG